jgi:hypothetical protein
MRRKDFQSIKESISKNLSPTDWRLFYSFLRAKSVKVFIVKIIVKNFKLSNIQMHIITLLKIDF